MNVPLQFRADGTFRILQLADIQDGPDVARDAVDLIEAAVREADPDLVVLTGDQIRGYDPAYRRTFIARRDDPDNRSAMAHGIQASMRLEQTLGRLAGACRAHETPGERASDMERTIAKVERTIAAFLRPIVSRGIPFAVTYGNHDFQCGVDLEEQDRIYARFPGYVGRAQVGENHWLDPGTYYIPVYDRAGSAPAMGVTLVNSGDYEPDGGYGAADARAVAWLRAVDRGRTAQGAPVPTIAFQHIAPPEIYDLLRPVSRFTAGAIRGFRSHADRCYVVDERLCVPGSRLGEPPSCSEHNSGEVAALAQTPGYFALFFGHDHSNTVIGSTQGLDLGYGPTCGFTSYGPPARERGLRVFEFAQSDPRRYRTRVLTFGELLDRRVRHPMRVLIGSTMLSSTKSIGNFLRRPRVAYWMGALAGAGIGFALAAHEAAHDRRKQRRRLHW